MTENKTGQPPSGEFENNNEDLQNIEVAREDPHDDDSLQAEVENNKHRLRLVFVMVGIVLAASFIIGKYIDY